ncbi:hypothetical protein HA466_0287690 [Hirschfeldia incana]|nr:hypothetical protein HA466_0287690 [Hirschfeldia incana]
MFEIAKGFGDRRLKGTGNGSDTIMQRRLGGSYYGKEGSENWILWDLMSNADSKGLERMKLLADLKERSIQSDQRGGLQVDTEMIQGLQESIRRGVELQGALGFWNFCDFIFKKFNKFFYVALQ